jgi:hypothetical protein
LGSGGSISLLRDYVTKSRDTTTVREADTLDDAGTYRGGSLRETASSGFVRDEKIFKNGSYRFIHVTGRSVQPRH